MISHAAALPTQVLTPSIACRKPWTFIHYRRCVRGVSTAKHRPVSMPDGAVPVRAGSSDRFLRVRAPVVVERHLAAHDGVLFPLRGPLGECELRFDDLLEQWILRRLLSHDVVSRK